MSSNPTIKAEHRSKKQRRSKYDSESSIGGHSKCAWTIMSKPAGRNRVRTLMSMNTPRCFSCALTGDVWMMYGPDLRAASGFVFGFSFEHRRSNDQVLTILQEQHFTPSSSTAHQLTRSVDSVCRLSFLSVQLNHDSMKPMCILHSTARNADCQ